MSDTMRDIAEMRKALEEVVDMCEGIISCGDCVFGDRNISPNGCTVDRAKMFLIDDVDALLDWYHNKKQTADMHDRLV